jgi:hypothetical protein
MKIVAYQAIIKHWSIMAGGSDPTPFLELPFIRRHSSGQLVALRACRHTITHLTVLEVGVNLREVRFAQPVSFAASNESSDAQSELLYF